MRGIQDPWPGARATRLRAAREAGAAYADATREEVAARVVENFIVDLSSESRRRLGERGEV